MLSLNLKLIISSLVVFHCEPVGGTTACTDDSQCSLAEACLNGVCIDPCKITNCGDPNSVCVNLEHKSMCICKYGFELGKNACKPEDSRTSPSGFVKCIDNAQCKPIEACQNGFCTDPCTASECRDPNALCVVLYQKPKCICKTGFILGYGGCKPDPGGRSSEVTDPCLTTDCRDPNAVCVILNQKPNCMCKSGFILGYGGCKPDPGGRSSEEKTRFVFVDLELPWEKAGSYCSQRGMKLATVEDAGKKSELQRFIQKIGNKELKTPQSSYYVYYPLPSRRLKFKYKANIGEGHLAFSKIDDNSFSGGLLDMKEPIVQVSVGSYQNKRVTIKRHYHKVLEKEIPNLVSSTEFRGFWIDFGRVYRLGKQNEETALATWEDPEPFYANYFGIHSGWGSFGIWSFYGETVTKYANQKTHNPYHYTRLPQFSLDITVRANEGVQIALTSGPQDTSPMYEIILGGWGNTASAIRYQQADKVRVDTPGLLSAWESRRFRISWKDGVVKVVNQYGEMVMKWQNKEYVEITHYGLMSPRGEASWGVVVTDDVNGLATTGRLWLGAEQLEGDQFKWLGSGQPVTSDWYTGEIYKGWTRAKEYIGYCLSTAPLVFGLDGTLNNLQWFKADCFTEFKFICERTVYNIYNYN